ncbi:MAG: hypothetical protein JWO19_939 [Bryobacterales bacterium]|nr:hypothetical protein [Bryobacterales bacterium]
MATAVTTFGLIPAGETILQTPAGPVTVLLIPWRDAHTVEPEELQQYISMLEAACVKFPRKADFRTCLGMAHAMNYDPRRSMDALEEARRIEPDNFFAQLKLAELHCSLRALDIAEKETLKAADLAGDASELALAREHLAEVRSLKYQATPASSKPLPVSAVVLMLLVTLIVGILLAWK